ncbi:alpha/beta hydrolase [Coralloluteibacterium thermophilus]|uniref:Alpha/beta hydrolase n=1 Tax=Coralloluteibacterium thermophilum TaxID=2707049 RepID=A0ABV9NNE9_9GAMM
MTPETFPTESTSFLLPGPAGALEVAVDLPEEDPRPAVAVLCHPLPTEGGTMHNKVVTMTARALRELGVATVRFNFRGVGQSEGEFDNGRGETLDLIAVAEWVQQVLPDHDLWLGGFSFGAYVSLLGARKLPVKQMISIAPPAGRWDFSAALPPDAPWLVVQGEEDDIVSPQAVYDWIEQLDARPTLVKMPEADHFFHRRLLDLRGAIKNGVRRNLPPSHTPAADA